MISTGKNPDDHMAQSRHMVQIGSSTKREVDSYKLDKYKKESIIYTPVFQILGYFKLNII
jgi:hypothetical protein